MPAKVKIGYFCQYIPSSSSRELPQGSSRDLQLHTYCYDLTSNDICMSILSSPRHLKPIRPLSIATEAQTLLLVNFIIKHAKFEAIEVNQLGGFVWDGVQRQCGGQTQPALQYLYNETIRFKAYMQIFEQKGKKTSTFRPIAYSKLKRRPKELI